MSPKKSSVIPLRGLIFLRFADQRFAHVERELTVTVHVGSRRTIGKADYQARGVMYLPAHVTSMLMTYAYMSKANTTARCMKMSTIMWSLHVALMRSGISIISAKQIKRLADCFTVTTMTR